MTDHISPHVLHDHDVQRRIAAHVFGPAAQPVHTEKERTHGRRRLDNLIICRVDGSLKGIIIEIKAAGDVPREGQANDLAVLRVTSLWNGRRVEPVIETRHLLLAPERHPDFTGRWQHLKFADVFTPNPCGATPEAAERINGTLRHEATASPLEHLLASAATMAATVDITDVELRLSALDDLFVEGCPPGRRR